jgi:type IV pilus assembly protein PilB
MAGRLGDILVDRGWITEEQVESALKAQGPERGMLGTVLLRRGLIDADQLGKALEQQFEVRYTEVVPDAINPQLVRLLPEDFSRDRQVVPYAIDHGALHLCMVAPDDIETISEAELITGYRVLPSVSLQHDVMAALDRGFDEQLVARQTIVDMKLSDLLEGDNLGEDLNLGSDDEDAAPVVRLVKSTLMGAIHASASDIHLEPHHPEMRVRYRVDGELQQVMTIPNHIQEAVISRIKVMADMDTTETRRPQDGHLKLEEGETRANLRVSTIPTVEGEKVVLRILDEGKQTFQFDDLGMPARDIASIKRLIDKPHGMIVVTGPTGSGKSTTMYTMLSALNGVKRNIVTVEDPVEYRLAGINQVHSDNEHGMGFANALKYIMRQDPDVIMVGEIRDHETAQTSIQAALTGHLLISTLHTNDAVGAVARLSDLGIDRFKIAGALLGSIAQRLLRSICPECKEPSEPSSTMMRSLAQHYEIPADTVFFRGRGCKKCLHTGYSGRLPIFEIMPITPTLGEAIEAGLPASKLREMAMAEGMKDLAYAGIEQVFAGRTTIDEVYFKLSS